MAGLASPLMGGAGYGVAGGPTGQILVQAEGVAAVCAWSGAGTLAILLVVLRITGLRARDEEIEDGLDLSQHGERNFPA